MESLIWLPKPSSLAWIEHKNLSPQQPAAIHISCHIFLPLELLFLLDGVGSHPVCKQFRCQPQIICGFKWEFVFTLHSFFFSQEFLLFNSTYEDCHKFQYLTTQSKGTTAFCSIFIPCMTCGLGISPRWSHLAWFPHSRVSLSQILPILVTLKCLRSLVVHILSWLIIVFRWKLSVIQAIQTIYYWKGKKICSFIYFRLVGLYQMIRCMNISYTPFAYSLFKHRRLLTAGRMGNLSHCIQNASTLGEYLFRHRLKSSLGDNEYYWLNTISQDEGVTY